MESIGMHLSLVGAPLVAKDSRPLIGEIVCIVRTVEQAVNRSSPFRRVLIREELLGFCSSRQSTSEVDRDPAQEGSVTGKFRRRQAELGKFLENKIVNESARWR